MVMNTSHDRVNSHPLSGRHVCLFTALSDVAYLQIFGRGTTAGLQVVVGLLGIGSLIRVLELHSL